MARLRELHSELGLLTRADGSARLVQGSTAVLCAVYGPAEVKISKEKCDRATVEVLVKPGSGQSGPGERHLEELVSSTCEAMLRTTLHPHTAISITLQIENNAGSLLSVMLNACCLAMKDACLPLTSEFSAVSFGFAEDGDLLIDPDLEQEEACQSLFTFVVDGNSGNIATSHASGCFTVKQLGQCLGMAKETSKSITEFYRDTIRRRLSKTIKNVS